jgi:hypothetical protein
VNLYEKYSGTVKNTGAEKNAVKKTAAGLFATSSGTVLILCILCGSG